MKVKSFRIRDRNQTNGYGEIIDLGATSDNVEIVGETTSSGEPKNLTTKIAEIVSSVNSPTQKKIALTIDSSSWTSTSTSDNMYTYNYKVTLNNNLYTENSAIYDYNFPEPKIDYYLRPFKFVFSSGQLTIYTRMPAAENIKISLVIGKTL